VRGIKNLVSSAVPNLKSSDVMLIDSDGETLGDEDEMSQMSDLSLAQQKFKTREEKKRQRKIIDVVAPFVGGEKKVVAQVTIEYDFSLKNSTSETYDPESVVRSEQVSEEKREGGSPEQVGGVPGTVSNIGPVQGLKSTQTKEKYSKNTGTTNYEIGKTVSTTKSQFARIKRITAAVVVDGKYITKLDDKNQETSELEYVSLGESEISALTSLVSRSIGLNISRGDEVSVQNLQFQRNAKEPSLDGVSQAVMFSETYLAPFSELFKYIFVLLLLFILYKKVIIPFSEKMLEISKDEEELERPSLELDDDEDDGLVEKVQAMRKKVEDQLGVGQNFNEDDLKHEVVLEKVRMMTTDAPEDIAALLQALLEEEAEAPNASKLNKV
jgi:flagellar M-ring protein FliF